MNTAITVSTRRWGALAALLLVFYTISAVSQTPGRVTFSHAAGFYTQDFMLQLTPASGTGTIYYTTDGSDPDFSSAVYNAEIRISDRSSDPNIWSLIPTNTMNPEDLEYREGWKPPQGSVAKVSIIRARLGVNGVLGPISTQTFFVFPEGRARYSVSVFSLVADPDHFFDDDTGIYVPGNNDNFWQRGSEWERPVHIEFWEQADAPVLTMDGGMRINGNTTRSRARKSLRLYAKSEYGTSWFNHAFFPDQDHITRYKRLILRNGGNDWSEALFRDDMMQSLFAPHADVDAQATRTVIVFLNGEYWGIHNLRERQDERYIQGHYDIDEDDMTSAENEMVFGDGDESGMNHLREMWDYIARTNLSSDANMATLSTYMNVDSYTDQMIGNIFFANTDWPGNNQKFWRKNVPFTPDAEKGHDGRWRWFLNDIDFGFGLNFHYVPGVDVGPLHNTMAMAIAPNGPSWPNPEWSTRPLRKMLQNQQYKQEFSVRFSDLLNTVFAPDYVVAHIDSFINEFRPEMSEHILRWGWPLSQNHWQAEVNRIRNYGRLRAPAVFDHVAGALNTSKVQIQVWNTSTDGGYIRINGVLVKPGMPGIPDAFTTWTGTWFAGMEVEVEAVPAPGYVFLGWDAAFAGNDEPVVREALSRNRVYRAKFGLASSIDDEMMHPEAFELLPNFPNPFNPSTHIAFDLNQSGEVLLRVFTPAGALVHEEQRHYANTGRHTWLFQASHLSTGMYLYQVTFAGVQKTGKMTLLK